MLLLFALLVRCELAAQPTVIYSTGFEKSEGFDPNTTLPLIGQGGWVGSDTNGNGVLEDFFPGKGQQAFVGFSPLSGTNDSLSVWQPLNVSPLAIGKPIVKFSVSFEIFDSTNGHFDAFQWSVYNTNNGGVRLFTLDFDNSITNINYQLDDGVLVDTGFTFEPDGFYRLVIVMNFASNTWSASLSDVVIVNSLPITKRGSALNLGDIDAVWYHLEPGSPGDNFMVFDDYRVTAESLPSPFRLEPLGWLLNGSFSLRLTGETGRTYAIDASPDLRNWTAIRTNTAVGGTFDVVDSGATNSVRRFYRARFVP